MTLSCECDDWCPEPGDWYFSAPRDYSNFAERRRVRCSSCKVLISPGDLCVEFERFKVPDGAIQERIWGEDGAIPIASWWHCENCADLYYSLSELGFCFPINESMRNLAREYAEMTEH